MNALSESFPLTPDFAVRFTGRAVRPSDFRLNPRALGRQRNWKYFECRGASGVSAGDYPALNFCGHKLDLETPEPVLFAGLEPSVRRAIRKAPAEPIAIEIKNDLASVRAYYVFFCQPRRRHDLPPQPFRFFASIHRQVIARALGWVIQARCRGRIAASAVLLRFGGLAVYKFGASVRNLQPLRSNRLLIWAAIKWYAARGFVSLHSGRTSFADEGLRPFTLGFGPREERLECSSCGLRKGGVVSTPDRSQSLLTVLFCRLPTVVLSTLAVALYLSSPCLSNEVAN